MVPPSAIVALVKIDKILLMKKFAAIEGLRGWLAWTVVLCHFAPITNMEKGLGRHLVWAGLYAVLVFIIISGFVITHLVTERSEPYRDYLLRRFMRIFPLFAVTCVIGFFTTNLFLCRDCISQPVGIRPGFRPSFANVHAMVPHNPRFLLATCDSPYHDASWSDQQQFATRFSFTI